MNAQFATVAAEMRAAQRDEADSRRRALNLAAEEIASAAHDAYLNASPAAMYAAAAVARIGQIHSEDAVLIIASLFDAMKRHNTHDDQRVEAMVCLSTAAEALAVLIRRDAE